MKWEFIAEAEAEFQEAYNYYERCGNQLGERFLDQVAATIELIRLYPSMWTLVGEDIRRAPVFKFPYCLLYIVEDERIVIYALMHYRRDPNYWKKRLS